MRLNATAYAEYSPVFLPITFLVTYTGQFALAAALLVHTALYHGPELVRRFRRPFAPRIDDDVHINLMRTYPDVPDWWYGALLAIPLGLAMTTVAVSLVAPGRRGAGLTSAPRTL